MIATLTHISSITVSPMLLADRMLTLAQQAERAGLLDTAGRLVALAHTVFDEPAALSHPQASVPQLTTIRGGASARPRSNVARIDAAMTR